MSEICEGINAKRKPNLKLDGKKVIVEYISCYQYDKKTDTGFSYIREVIYHFSDEEKAMEFYYKMK